MSEMWTVILLVALVCTSIKAVGPLVLGDRRLPDRATTVIGLLATAMITALVVTQTFGVPGGVTLDERAAGVGVTVLAMLLRLNILVAVGLGVLVTAMIRLVF